MIELKNGVRSDRDSCDGGIKRWAVEVRHDSLSGSILVEQNVIGLGFTENAQLVDLIEIRLKIRRDLLGNHSLLRWHSAVVDESSVLELSPSHRRRLLDVMNQQLLLDVRDEVGNVIASRRHRLHNVLLKIQHSVITNFASAKKVLLAAEGSSGTQIVQVSLFH